MPFLFLGCILGVSVGVFLFSCLKIYVEDVGWGISSVFRICWSDPVVASCIFRDIFGVTRLWPPEFFWGYFGVTRLWPPVFFRNIFGVTQLWPPVFFGICLE